MPDRNVVFVKLIVILSSLFLLSAFPPGRAVAAEETQRVSPTCLGNGGGDDGGGHRTSSCLASE